MPSLKSLPGHSSFPKDHGEPRACGSTSSTASPAVGEDKGSAIIPGYTKKAGHILHQSRYIRQTEPIYSSNRSMYCNLAVTTLGLSFPQSIPGMRTWLGILVQERASIATPAVYRLSGTRTYVPPEGARPYHERHWSDRFDSKNSFQCARARRSRAIKA